RWQSGEAEPHGQGRDRLLRLYDLLALLRVHLDDGAVKAWLWTPQSSLDDARAFDRLVDGDFGGVRAAAAQIASSDSVADGSLVRRAEEGNGRAYDQLVRRYRGFVRARAASYSLVDSSEDLVQEGLLGLFKAVRDFRLDGETTSFRSFAELCVTRQLLTAVKS